MPIGFFFFEYDRPPMLRPGTDSYNKLHGTNDLYVHVHRVGVDIDFYP